MEAFGALAALGAAALFGAGMVIQARESRLVSREHAMRVGLLLRLARSWPWLAGTALTLVGWGLQALALGLAPITVVQPLLGLTLAVVLALGWWMMGDRVRGADVAGIALLGAGATVLVLAAPGRGSDQASGLRLVLPLAVLGAAALLPLIVGRRLPVTGMALAAGVAFALCGIATKLFADSAGSRDLWPAALALALTAASAAAGGISSMSALQSGAVSRVVAAIYALEIALPVLFAPLLFGERWDAMTPPRGAALVAAVAAVLAGTTLLARSEGVAAASAPPHAPTWS